MTVHERKYFFKEQCRLEIDDMSLREVSHHLAKLYGPDTKVFITPEQYDKGYYYSITALVPETDEEMNTRINAEVRRAKIIEENEKR